MNKIETEIDTYIPGEGEVAVYWMGGAGFILKSNKLTLGIDLYLSNAVCDGKNYKRLTVAPVSPENLKLDYLIASHEHGDHMDVGSIFALVGQNTLLVGPDSALDVALECGVARTRMFRLNRGDLFQDNQIRIKAVKADHGELSPQAIGAIIKMEGKTIYFTGDTCYRTDFNEMIQLDQSIDLVIVPINSTFGNPGPDGAAYIASAVNAKRCLPCHYWLFREHGGDPQAYLDSCKRIVPNTKAEILAMGERMII